MLILLWRSGKEEECRERVLQLLEPCELGQEDEELLVALMQRTNRHTPKSKGAKASSGGMRMGITSTGATAVSMNSNSHSPEYLPATGCRKSLPVGKLGCHQHDGLRRRMGLSCAQDMGPSPSD